MTAQFSEYKDLIEELAPKANRPEFGLLLREKTKTLSTETRFLLKMEMKRLAKPCIRSIDLRIMVDAECKLVDINGIQHYLSENAMQTFDTLVEQYGEYTFGVYESLIEDTAKNQEHSEYFPQTLVEQDIELESDDDNKASWEKYLTPYDELMFYHHRRDERMNYVVDVDIYVSASQKITATTVDISHRGLRIKLDDQADMVYMKSFRPLMLVFSRFSHSSGLSKEMIEYKVVRITGEDQQARIHLSRDWHNGPKRFNEHIAKLIKNNKRRYKVNLDNTLKALESKIYEQAFASNSPSLSLFVNSQDDEHPFIEYACVNSFNIEVLDYWQDEERRQNIGFLLNKERLIHLMTDNGSSPSLTIYSFNHVKENKVYFYSATQQELDTHPDLKDIFYSYGSRKVSWRVHRVQLTDILPRQAYLPSSVPNGVNKSIDLLNRTLSPRLQSKLQHLSHLVCVIDITSQLGQQCYQKRILDKDKIKELATFGHARNKPPKQIKVFRYTQQDKRKQTRYQLRTSVIVADDIGIEGVTEDISVSGLRIELSKPIDTRANAKLSVSFPNLQEKTDDFDLTNLRYRIKHISADCTVLHLEAISEDELSIAEQFFARLIDNNKDKLVMLSNEESVPGMGAALRSIQSKATSQLAAYITRTPLGYLPVKVSTSNVRSRAVSFMRHEVPLNSLNLSWLFQDRKNNNAVIQKALKTLKINATMVTNEIYVAFDSANLDPEQASQAHWETEMSSHKAKYKFIKQSLQQQQFFAFRVSVNTASRPDTVLLQDELQYVSQYAIHKAKELEELMWNIEGELYITDITDEVLVRYQLA